MTSVTDPNGAAASTSYGDAYFWRPASTTDPLGNVTYYNYYGTSNNPGGSQCHLGRADGVCAVVELVFVGG